LAQGGLARCCIDGLRVWGIARAGQGLGRLGGLTLIGPYVPDTDGVAANAVMNIGGYLPAGLLTMSTAYAIDFLDPSAGAVMFAIVLTISALVFGGAGRRMA
jgi:hypothetical protein